MSMRLAFSVLLAVVAGALLFTAFAFGTVARRVPVVVLAPTLILLLAQVVMDLRDIRRPSGKRPGDDRSEAYVGFVQAALARPEFAAIAVAIAIALAVDLLGVAIAVPLLLGTFLAVAASVTPLQALVAGLAMLGIIDVGLGRLLGALLPDGRLLHWMGL
jgi:hypothetical protein